MTETANYPDILGYITEGRRFNLNVLQLALGVRPRVVRAGRSFEVILLVQNASDVNIDLQVNMELPERDAKKQKGKFQTGKNRLVVGLRPAEVGYIKLPASCQPDTAVDDNYKISMEVKVKALEKPGRIRNAEGGGGVFINTLRPEVREELENLRKLSFSTEKRFGLRDVLEVSFGVMPGRLGQIANLQPGWVNLWSLSDHSDEEALLTRYGARLVERALPQLRGEQALTPLLEATQTHFSATGYTLHPGEALMIAKLLTFMLEMSAPSDDAIDYLDNPAFNIRDILEKHAAEEAENGAAPELPRWFDGLLHHVARNEELIRAPAQVVSKLLYLDLVRDVIPHTFRMLKIATGQELGTAEEIEAYADQLHRRLVEKQEMDFTHTYMPLVLGGIMVYDRIVGKDEELLESLRSVSDALMERDADLTDDDEPVFEIAKELINRHARQFGFEL